MHTDNGIFLFTDHQDFLHQDLNNRLLAQRDPVTPIALPSALPASPYIRGETHQHQHQHLHNHMHQHNYGINGIQAQLVPPATPLVIMITFNFQTLRKHFFGITYVQQYVGMCVFLILATQFTLQL